MLSLKGIRGMAGQAPHYRLVRRQRGRGSSRRTKPISSPAAPSQPGVAPNEPNSEPAGPEPAGRRDERTQFSVRRHRGRGASHQTNPISSPSAPSQGVAASNEPNSEPAGTEPEGRRVKRTQFRIRRCRGKGSSRPTQPICRRPKQHKPLPGKDLENTMAD